MGHYYKYCCSKCGFEHQYFTGGGFYTDDYYEKTNRLADELRKDIVQGKYGTYLKKMMDIDTDGKLSVSCSRELFQCFECSALLVWREKKIYLKYEPGYHCKIDVEIEQSCPSCGSKLFWKVKNEPVCPNCKETIMELKAYGEFEKNEIDKEE